VTSPRAAARGWAALLPVLVVLLVVLAGRYSLDRAGIGGITLPDLRIAGLLAAIALAVLAARRRAAAGQRQREGWLIAAGLFFGYQIASGLWAPSGARVSETTVDVALLGVLTVTYYLCARADPARVARWTFGFFLAAALLLAAGALAVSGPGAQGRYAAFGGGPNIFVRVELLGVIAAIALYRFTGRLAILLAVPPLTGMAVLSGSRGGLLAGLAVGVIALVGTRVRLPARPSAVVLGGSAALVAAAAAFAPARITEAVRVRLVEQTFEQGYASGRTQIWGAAGDLAGTHPLFGAGLDGFYGLIGRRYGIQYPHNYLIAVAAEGGLIGLALLVTAVGLWIGTVRRSRALRTETLLAVTAAGFVALDAMFSGDNYDARVAWIFAALAAACAVRSPAQAPS
jgi:O-antigen ligase